MPLETTEPSTRHQLGPVVTTGVEKMDVLLAEP